MEVLTEDGSLITGSNEVLSKWKDDFEALLTNKKISDLENNFLGMTVYFKNCQEGHMIDPLYTDDEQYSRIFNIKELECVLDKAKNGKATGIDYVPYEILKYNSLGQILLEFFQLCFDSGHIPSVWTKAVIVPIPKSPSLDNRVPSNYRGLSLLCSPAKLHSSILNRRIVEYLENNNLLLDEQNGFRANRSCLDHVFVLTNLIRTRLEHNKDTFVAFIDVQKAFDHINSDLLFSKL